MRDSIGNPLTTGDRVTITGVVRGFAGQDRVIVVPDGGSEDNDRDRVPVPPELVAKTPARGTSRDLSRRPSDDPFLQRPTFSE